MGRRHNPSAAPAHRRRRRHHQQTDSTPPDLHPMEERIAAQTHEIQALIADNQRLASSHVALKQDVADIQQEIRRLSATAASVKAEKDAQVREVYERYQKLEAESVPVGSRAAELDRVRAEIKERVAERKELYEKITQIDGDIAKAKSELQQLPQLKAVIEDAAMEIQRGRFAIEYEIKLHAHHAKVGEVMEKHLNSMTQEAEKLRSELGEVEKRAAEATSGAISSANQDLGYAAHQTNPEPLYGGAPSSDPHAVHQGNFDSGSNHAPGTAGPQLPPAPYDIQGQHQIQS
ncbi:protein FLX-like 1 [Andrographis paniculata]|uniref:protein FLX-like 1 n=1 Tax=Andrographis paniculata TaxID=175694 RepID=UPI0021E81B4A|nr:protein FLX-like 1 [Andrographis paniculata]